jgi:hypothetical protein
LEAFQDDELVAEQFVAFEGQPPDVVALPVL